MFRLILIWVSLAAALIPAATMAESVLRIGVTAMPPAEGNPYKQIATTSNFILPAIYDVLAVVDNDGNVVPRLAESWTNPDPLTWIFKLRDGVTFSNGEPLDAEGVKIVFDALRAPAAVTAGLTTIRAEAEHFARIDVIDRLTLSITLTEPNALLSRRIFMLYVAPGRYFQDVGYDGLAKNPVGTGPFVAERWTVNEIAMRANPASWRAPAIDRLEFRALPDGTARTQALISGQLDAAIAINPDQAGSIELAGARVTQRSPIRVLCIAFDTTMTRNPFWDQRVRMAANLAVDRERITMALLDGRVEGADQGAIKNAVGYVEGLGPYPFDPARARELLAEAGYADGVEFVFAFPTGTLPNDAAIMQQVAADLRAVGIRAEPRAIPYAQFVSYTGRGGWPFQGLVEDFNNNAFDALSPYTRGGHSCSGTAPWYCDPAIQPLIDAAEREPDLARRTAMTEDIVRYYYDKATTLLLFPVAGLDAVGPRVSHWETWNDQIQFDLLAVAD